MKYYFCFPSPFGCGHNEIHLLPIPYSPTFCKAPTTPTTFSVLNTGQNDLFKDVWHFFCKKICWNQNNSLILPITHRKPICKGEWVIYWKGRLRNVILESSNLANLKPSPKVRQRGRPQRVYYIPTYSEQPLLSRGYSLYLIIIRHGVGYLCCLSLRWRQCESPKTEDRRSREAHPINLGD